MKIAIASDDGEIISHHFGRTEGFKIYEIKNKKIIGEEYRKNAGYGGCGNGGCNHKAMVKNIGDCDFVVSYGMGIGIYQELMNNNITAIVTDVENVDKAIKEFIEETLESHPEKLH
ncbi:MAG: NifB/NifX family molybdenum-iron cluster-binding protein [Candidatus Methanofastidiosia archaeon]